MIYKQGTYGTLIGSLLSPIIADIIMQDLAKVLGMLNLSIYYRYVDDLICPKDVLYDVFSKFNSYHERLKFIVEIEKNHCLNFLNISLIVRDNKIIINWINKESFSR